jgi:hypothetical protein
MIKDIIVLCIALPPSIWLLRKIYKGLQEMDNKFPPTCFGRECFNPQSIAENECWSCKWEGQCIRMYMDKKKEEEI